MTHLIASLAYAKTTNSYEKGYTWYAWEYLAEFAHAKGNKEQALAYYKEIKEYAPRNKAIYDRAKKYIKKNKKKKGWFIF